MKKKRIKKEKKIGEGGVEWVETNGMGKYRKGGEIGKDGVI